MAAVRVWLWVVAAMILLMVVVGGATRLTESGLSITEWKPISGVIPPLNEADWQAEFARYKSIPQYARLFPDMDLAGFKAIFWWEWAHRLLGRLIGVVVAVPLAGFWLAGRLTRDLKWKLTALLLLGGLQGAIGWWMVSSGLSGRTEVSQVRLAVHLVMASLTLVLTVWIAESLTPAPAVPARGGIGLKASATVLLAGVLLQIGLGGLVAGLRAGRIYDTWPTMGGNLVPPASELLFLQPVWRNLVDNAVTAQLDHRLLAYLLVCAGIAHAVQAMRAAPHHHAARTALLLALALTGQATIGIVTLVTGVPLGVALLHQTVAMVVLALAVVHRCGLRAPVRAGAPTDPTAEVIGLPAFATSRR